jgi:non-homologous end joining protein Ku
MRTVHKSERENLVKALYDQNESHKLEREELVKSLESLNNKIIVIFEKSIRTDEQLAQALNNRPCLAKIPQNNA